MGTESYGSFDKIAEVQKDEPPVSSAFFGKSAKVTKRKEVNN